MKKFCSVLVLVVFFCCGALAQADEQGYVEGAWDLNGVTGINLSQTTLVNWSAGGENSMAGNIYLNGSLKHKTGDWLWVNTLVLEYGLSKVESQGNRKTNDNIDFSTQLGYSISDKWFFTGMGSFKTQFYNGYNYPDKDNYISKFMAPAYSNLSLGVEFRPKSITPYLFLLLLENLLLYKMITYLN